VKNERKQAELSSKMQVYESVIVPGDEDPVVQQIRAEQRKKEIETKEAMLAQMEVGTSN
jgi:hypothetical protein